MKNIAHNIDYGVSVAKDVYRILEPVIKEYAGHNHGLHGHAMKAMTGYENLRNQAMEAHNHVSNVGQKTLRINLKKILKNYFLMFL